MSDPIDETVPALDVTAAKTRSLALIQQLLDRIPVIDLAPIDAQPAAVGAVARTLHPGRLPGMKRYPGTAAKAVLNTRVAERGARELVDWLAIQPRWTQLERYLDEEFPRFHSPDGYEVSVSVLRPTDGYPMVCINVVSPDFVPPASHHQAIHRY
ncbi:hypothetical protein [uncultured Gulosibacter sp.]|uniref:hypothetical protein n=1 Tax=uncultured Gulosibacter sp. TaxID=1339167 RepID=UPI00288986A0|nr:hypothetical protein [uncultured Gulosibacter sp.]